MLSEMDPQLRAKFPHLKAVIVCDADVRCGKTSEPCIQMDNRGLIYSRYTASGSDLIVDRLPEVPNATGCLGCEVNLKP